MRHGAYAPKDDAEHLVIAIGNATSAEDTWFASGPKTGLHLGGGIRSSGGSPPLVDVDDTTAAAVVSGHLLASSTAGQVTHYPRPPLTLALHNKHSLHDEQLTASFPHDTEYYARLWLPAKAAAPRSSHRKWHFLRKKSDSFFKLKRSSTNVSRSPAAAIDDKVYLSESERRPGRDVTQRSEVATAAPVLLCMPPADDQAALRVDGAVAIPHPRQCASDSECECDASDESTSLICETRRAVRIQLPPSANTDHEKVIVDLPQRVELLHRSTSVPGIPVIPKLTVNGVEYNPSADGSSPSKPSLSSTTRLGKWSRSKIDLLPTFKSLVTMTTHKLASSRSSNLHYCPATTCNGHFGSNLDVRKLRRHISLNNLASGSGFDHEILPKMASSQDIRDLYAAKKKLRKSNTLSSLPGCSAHVARRVQPLKPINRLRLGSTAMSTAALSVNDKIICSRCSSILSMASSSRYSVNSNYGFVPLTAVNCKVCLNEVPLKDSWTLQHCECTYCVDCVRSYVEFEINQGAYSISCPDAQCEKQGIILLEEIESLVSLECIEKHKRYRLNREVEMDKSRTWCPRAGCETVCTLGSADRCTPQSVHCPTCSLHFCSNCRHSWHADSACKSEEAVPGLTFDSELIKCCPMCSVPIEKDEGCAQMLCKRCKHVFCWYCLASLDDDFLLRHYDKGPCKNKLGHSRASVIWHRTQVISIFAGFGILLLIASPLLLLAAPCIVCCRCRVCTSDSKLDSDDDLPDPAEQHLNADGDSDHDQTDTDAFLHVVPEEANTSSAT